MEKKTDNWRFFHYFLITSRLTIPCISPKSTEEKSTLQSHLLQAAMKCRLMRRWYTVEMVEMLYIDVVIVDTKDMSKIILSLSIMILMLLLYF